jgi:DNA-binding response OmpR family regulator
MPARVCRSGSGSSGAAPDATAPRVLLVGADRDTLAGTRAYLERFCRRVFAARSLSVARRVLLDQQIDVVLCDLNVGNGDGLRFLDYVRERRPAVLRLLLTAASDEIERRPVFPAASAVVRKPCDLRNLRSLLELIETTAATFGPCKSSAG